MRKFFSGILLGGLWILMAGRSTQSVLILFAIFGVFYLVDRKQNNEKNSTDLKIKKFDGENIDYEASYNVSEIHNDFTRVGKGVPVPENQIASCCNPFQGHNRPKLQNEIDINDDLNKNLNKDPK